MRLKVLGCGDAFGSGGVPHTAFHLSPANDGLLIDCGASTLIQLRKFGMSSDDVDGILVSHFHGDHYGGIPFLLLEAALVRQRKKPLFIYGPPGLEQKLKTLQEALYPGTSEHMERLDLRFITYRSHSVLDNEVFTLRTRSVIHANASHPHGMRLEAEGKVLAFSGDTSWTDELIPLADGADLFICECNFFDRSAPGHIHYTQLREKLDQLNTKRTLLTHLGPDMLERVNELDHEVLTEGAEYDI